MAFVRTPLLAASLLVSAALCACAPSDPVPAQPTGVVTSPVIYGDDDRREYYELDEAERPLLEAAATFIARSSLDFDDAGRIGYDATTLADDDVCPGERFLDQPAASECSAALIDDRLLITAGHCVHGGVCPSDVFLFGFWYAAPGEFQTATEDDIYTCRRVVARENDVADYAVIELDRPVTSATPLPVDVTPVAVGDALTLVGFPDALPGKLAANGEVIGLDWEEGTAFGGTVDAFSGNSGSAVIGEDGAVVGILVAGEDDYVWDAGAHCYRTHVLPADGGDGGETITAIDRVIDAICDAGYPSERLCGTTGTCGDGFCTGEESSESCEEDCGFGPGLPPPGWTCDPAYYFVGDDCDCGCGLPDPDCDDPDLGVYGCPDAWVCSEDGACVHPSLPDAWSCDPGWYEAGDDCDCDCGTYDPDCDDPRLEILNCGRGQICGPDGACTDPDPGDTDTGRPDVGTGDADPDPGDTANADTAGDGTVDAATDVTIVVAPRSRGGCSVREGGRGTGLPALSAAVWLLFVRRRARPR